MHRPIARTLTALALVGAMLGLAAPAAQAAPAAAVPVNMTFDAGGPVAQGAAVTLTGRVWVKQTGNRSRVEFWFQRLNTTAWTYAGFVNSTDRGNFAKRTTVRYSGTWKAVYRGSATRRGTLRVDSLKVTKSVPKQVAAYSQSMADWQGPTVRIPTADYRATITYNCTDENGGYMWFAWNGNPDVEESVESAEPSGTLTLNGHGGSRTGFFEVDTWVGCTWSVQVFAGTTRVAV